MTRSTPNVGERYETYTTKWRKSESSFVTPKRLAEAGFIWTGYRDHAQCVFCHGVIGEWVKGDIPILEHLRFYPQCPFVRSNMDGRALNGYKQLPIPKYGAEGQDECGYRLSTPNTKENDAGFLHDFVCDETVPLLNSKPTGKLKTVKPKYQMCCIL